MSLLACLVSITFAAGTSIAVSLAFARALLYQNVLGAPDGTRTKSSGLHASALRPAGRDLLWPRRRPVSRFDDPDEGAIAQERTAPGAELRR